MRSLAPVLACVACAGCVNRVPDLTEPSPERRWTGAHDPELADGRLRGSHPFDVFGSRARAGGDSDGDGRPDLLIAAPHADPGGSMSGAVYVFHGPAGDQLADRDEDAKLAGEAPGDWAGFGLAWAGDLDADGDDDVVVGARLADRGGTSAGAVYLVPLPVHGTHSLGDVGVILAGDEPGDEAGMSVDGGGDADGDGRADVWVGAPYAAESGAAYLVSGAVSASGRVGDEALAVLVGESADDRAAMDVTAIGDADGDGRGDVALGAEGSDRGGTDAGAAYVVHAPFDGVIPLGESASILVGEAPGDQAGASTTAVGDLDGDGRVDLGVHARDESTGADGAGAFYVVSGPLPAEGSLADAGVKLLGEGENDYAGAHAATCDFDGDGALDLVVSAHEAGPGPETGRVYVRYGPVPRGVASLAAAEAVFVGDEDQSNVGQDVACVDLDGDSAGDLVIGAEGDDNEWGGDYAGSVYVARGG